MGSYLKSKNTRKAFIEATGELAAEKGFSNVSVREIANQANGNISGINYHFGNKETLFREVIRTISKAQKENSILKILESNLNELDTPEGQSRVLGKIIKHCIILNFSHEYPWWFSKIIYQVLQTENPFQQILKKDVIDPDLKAFKIFVKKVDPELSEERALLYIQIILGTTINYAYSLEDGLLDNRKKYSSEFLKELEEILTRQSRFLLGLPY